MKHLLHVLQRGKKKSEAAELDTSTSCAPAVRYEGPGYTHILPISSANPSTKSSSESGSGRRDFAGWSAVNGTENPYAVFKSRGWLASFLSKGGAYRHLQRVRTFPVDDSGTAIEVQQLFTLKRSAGGVHPQARTLLNHVQPINCLPQGVLSVIFRLAVGPTVAPNLRVAILLSSVCRNWRMIILGDGVMWSSIHVPGGHPTFVAQQLERCRGAPLHLFVDIPLTISRVEELTSSILWTLRAINVRREQVQTISATVGDCRVFHELFGSDWPNLEELVWIDACQTWSMIHEEGPPIPKAHQTPKLRYLSAHQGLTWRIVGATSLTTLKFEGPMDIDVLEFLRANSRLKSIEFVNLDLQPSPGNAAPFDLPDVTSVVMRGILCTQLFLCVTFSSLSRLVIDTLRHVGPVRAISWGLLQAPPNLTTLEVRYLPHLFPDKISVTGSDEIGTNSLSITESTASWRDAPTIRAPSNTLLSSVTSLSVGRGTLGFGTLPPSAAICALVSGLPHLQYLGVFSHDCTLTVADHLCSHPLDCPELKILSLTFADSSCSTMLQLLPGFLSDRAGSDRWVHRVDCVILETRGEDLEEVKCVWELLSRDCRFAEYLRCDCVKDDCRRKPRLDMHRPMRMAGSQRYSYLPGMCPNLKGMGSSVVSGRATVLEGSHEI